MNFTRREWLLGSVGATMAGCAGTEETLAGPMPADGGGGASADSLEWEFPVILLELAEKRDVYGHVLCRPAARMVTIDLEVDDDWGDINSMIGDEGLTLGLGDDEHGYWRIARAFELREPREELHEGRFPVAHEISLGALREMLAKVVKERG